MGKAKQRKARRIEEKESHRWLHSLRRTAEVQRLCPAVRLVNLADREADIYELFQAATGTTAGPHLLIRANRSAKSPTQRACKPASPSTWWWPSA